MKHLILSAVGMAAFPAFAQEMIVPQTPAFHRHEVGIQVPVWHRAKVSFSGVIIHDAGPITGDPEVDARRDRFYDDGFMRVNAAGNPDFPIPGESFHRSSYFRFESNSQVTAPQFGGAGTTFGHVSMHNVDLAGGEYADPFSNDETPSVELFYRYGWLEREKWALDLELGLSWTRLEWEQSGNVGAVAGIREDRYNTGTVDPTVNVGAGATLPYVGSFDPSPGSPWIGSNPMRQAYYTSPATVNTRREVTYDSIMFRFGPALDWKPSDRWRLGILAGLTAGWATTDFSFRDRIVVMSPGIPEVEQAGEGRGHDFVIGLYSGVRSAYQLSPRWDVLVEARHLWVEDVRSFGSGRSVSVGLADGVAFSAGFSCRF